MKYHIYISLHVKSVIPSVDVIFLKLKVIHKKESEIMIIELEDNKYILNSLKLKLTEIGESL